MAAGMLKKREEVLKLKDNEIKLLTRKYDDLNKKLINTQKELNNFKEMALNSEKQMDEQFNLRKQIEKELKYANERVKEATQRADQTVNLLDQESQRSAQLEQKLIRQTSQFELQYQKQYSQYVQSMKQEEKYEKEKRTLEEKYNKLVRERDDLRDSVSGPSGAVGGKKKSDGDHRGEDGNVADQTPAHMSGNGTNMTSLKKANDVIDDLVIANNHLKKELARLNEKLSESEKQKPEHEKKIAELIEERDSLRNRLSKITQEVLRT